MHHLLKTFALCAFALVAAAIWAGETPDNTVASFKVAEGLQATVWAHEPGMVNPTNIDIDSRGRIWVTEAANYRSKKTRPEGDRIVICEDTDQDGKADSYKVFAQDPSLFSPLGICVMGDKVYVAQSPKMLVYTIDASGDKPTGPPEVFFDGFSGANHDHGLHSMVFGPDGRFYFNSGNDGVSNAEIKNSKGEVLVDTLGSNPFPKGAKWRGKDKVKGQLGYVQGMAFRCNPDGSEFTVLGHNFRNNYEVNVDSFGTAWQSDNDDDGNASVRINYVMEGGNFGYVGAKGTNWARDMEKHPGQTKQEAHWHQRDPGVVPNLLVTGGGSPTGICVYEGDLLPAQYKGAMIHCDAGPNVVRSYIPKPLGAGYSAESVELIKGKDTWFRPSDVCVGPDGAVYVADWYDPGVGGHAMGDDKVPEMRGRIYRLAPPGFKAAKPKVDLNSVDGQIAALLSPNLATRYLGYTKLAAGGDDAVKALENVWKKSENPFHRARALWLLARSEKGADFVKKGLKDEDVNIRVTALRAARMLKQDVIELGKKLVKDSSPFMWRELCLALNYESAERAADLLVELADKYDGQDRWYLEAWGIGCTGKEVEVKAAWQAKHKNKDAEIEKKILWRLDKSETVGMGGPAPGEKANLAELWVLAPFDAGGKGLDKDFGIEATAGTINLDAKYPALDGKDAKWEPIKKHDYEGTPGFDFNAFCAEKGARTDNVVAYLAIGVDSNEEQAARLQLGSDDGVKVWLNGKKIHDNNVSRAVQVAEDTVSTRLNKGHNVFLFKIENGNGPGGFVAQLATTTKVTVGKP